MRNLDPQNILMTTDTLGGVWNYSLLLTKTLQENDIHVHLATMGNNLSEDQWEAASKIENLTIYESDFALEWMEDPWKEVDEAGEWLLRLEEEIEPDIIHLNNYAHGNLDWRSPVLMVNHSCVLSWWEAVQDEPAPEKWNIYKRRVKAGLQAADVVVSITHSMLKSLHELYGPLNSTHVIYNGSDENDFYIREKKNVIFSMGRLWDEAKNVFCLQQIAPQLHWPVIVAGSENGNISRNPISNFTLAGQLSEMEVKARLAETSIYVMPARYEPFGLSVLEAALSGCALVLGDIPTLRELWDGAALFADPNEPQQFRTRINKLIHSPELRNSLVKRSMNRAREFSLHKKKNSYLALYRQLVANTESEPVTITA